MLDATVSTDCQTVLLSRILDRANRIRTHHLVVLVLQDVAMPHELPRTIERRFHARDLAGVGDHGVLGARLPRLGRPDNARGVFAFDDTSTQALRKIPRPLLNKSSPAVTPISSTR